MNKFSTSETDDSRRGDNGNNSKNSRQQTKRSSYLEKDPVVIIDVAVPLLIGWVSVRKIPCYRSPAFCQEEELLQ